MRVKKKEAHSIQILKKEQKDKRLEKEKILKKQKNKLTNITGKYWTIANTILREYGVY